MPEPRTDWQDRFLEVFRDNGNITLTCRIVGVGRETVRRERARSEEFEERYQDALADAVEVVDAELRRRATTGTPTRTTVTRTFKDGSIETTVTDGHYISTAAAIAFLKAHHPAYREQWRIEHVGADGGPVKLQVERDRTPERLEALLTIAAELGWTPEQPALLPPPTINGN